MHHNKDEAEEESMENCIPVNRRNVLKLASAGAIYPLVGSSTTAAAGFEEIVLDNGDATFSGNWSTSAYRGNYYGSNYAYASEGTGGSVARWEPTISTDGDYTIYYWLPDGNADSATGTPYTIAHDGGTESVTVDQSLVQSGSWQRLGVGPYTLKSSSQSYVELSNDVENGDGDTEYVIADAMRFVRVSTILDNGDASFIGSWSTSSYRSDYYGSDYRYADDGTGGSVATWQPDLPTTGHYAIYYWLPAGNSDSAMRAPYTITFDGGTETVEVDQRTKNGGWYQLGDASYPFQSGTGGSVEVANDDVGGSYVFADAVKFVYVGQEPVQPTGLIAEADDGRTYLQWDNQSGDVEYDLKRATSSGGPYQTIASNLSVPLDGTTVYYVDDEVSNDTTYYYTVNAVNAVGESDDAAETSATPTLQPPTVKPKDLRPWPADGSVWLSWQPTSDATSYQIRRSATSGGPYTTIDTTTSSSYEDTSVTNGTAYHYVVRPVNDAGAGAQSSFQASAVPEQAAELILGDGDATFGGTWSTSEYSSGYLGEGYQSASGGSGGATARFEPTLSNQGDYSVWVHVPHGNGSYATNAPFTVDHENGLDTYRIDLRGAPADWKRLGSGTVTLSPGSGHGVELSNDADGTVIADAVRFVPASETPSEEFGVDWNDPHQQIEGIGCEIQFDCIGAGNDMSACTDERVPDALTQSEADRWYDEMLTGFRYVRLAMGLYLRGTDGEERLLQGRYSGQIADIAETVQESGTEVMPTYWSPTPYFKSSDDYLYGGLASTSPTALADMADAMVSDLELLESNGIDIGIWSLQNEPDVEGGTYSKCGYDPSEYADAFSVVGQRVRSAFPDVLVHGPDHNTPSVPTTGYGDEIKADPDALELIDVWSWHALTISDSPDTLVGTTSLWDEAMGRPIINTEYEYLDGDVDFVHTAKQVLYHFSYYDSPTFFWLHALKPTNVDQATGEGYSLGFFRPPSDSDKSDDSWDIDVGEWTFNDTNWNAIAGFVKRMPHDAVRYTVLGDDPDDTSRIVMAWEAPNGDRGLALLNASTSNQSFDVDLGQSLSLGGEAFSATERFVDLGTSTAATLSRSVDPETLEIWVE